MLAFLYFGEIALLSAYHNGMTQESVKNTVNFNFQVGRYKTEISYHFDIFF